MPDVPRNVYLVWNQDMTECVGFTNPVDAERVARRESKQSIPCVGWDFITFYPDDELTLDRVHVQASALT